MQMICFSWSEFPLGLRASMGFLFDSFHWFKRGGMIVCGYHRIESCVGAWIWRYEDIPMMWYLLAGNYVAFKRFVRRNHIKTVLCTASEGINFLLNVVEIVLLTMLTGAVEWMTCFCS